MADALDIYGILLSSARAELQREKIAMVPGLGRMAQRARDIFRGDPAKRVLGEMGVSREMMKNYRGSPREMLEALEASSAELVNKGVGASTARQSALANMQRDMTLAGRDNLGAQYGVVRDFRAAQQADNPAIQRAANMQKQVDDELAAIAPKAPEAAPAATGRKVSLPSALSSPSIGRNLAMAGTGAVAGGAVGAAGATKFEQGQSQKAQRRAFSAGLSAGRRRPMTPGAPNV